MPVIATERYYLSLFVYPSNGEQQCNGFNGRAARLKSIRPIDSLTHRTENDFLQTADHGPLDAQDRDVVLADLRRDLCGVWIIHLPRRYWQCGSNSHPPLHCGELLPDVKRSLLPQGLERLPRWQKSVTGLSSEFPNSRPL